MRRLAPVTGICFIAIVAADAAGCAGGATTADVAAANDAGGGSTANDAGGEKGGTPIDAAAQDGSPPSYPDGGGDDSSPLPDAGNPQVDAGEDSGGVSTLVPVIGGCGVFPGDNPWNTRVDDVVKFPAHPQSATFIANMNPSKGLHADWGDWSTDQYGIPWQTVPSTQAMVPMSFQDPSESDPGPYPFPPTALVEGGSGSGGDMHVLVLQGGTCALYETYSSTYVGPGWNCGSGAKFDLTSNALRPDGWTSGDAAGLPILPGLVKVSEVQNGAILHALRFTVNHSQQGYIHPATHAAGTSDATLPPMGLRVRLKASFDLSGYTGAPLVILTAMQEYGMLLADNGSDWFVTGDSDDAWIPLMDDIGQQLSNVTGGDFEAVQTGPISTNGL